MLIDNSLICSTDAPMHRSDPKSLIVGNLAVLPDTNYCWLRRKRCHKTIKSRELSLVQTRFFVVISYKTSNEIVQTASIR